MKRFEIRDDTLPYALKYFKKQLFSGEFLHFKRKLERAKTAEDFNLVLLEMNEEERSRVKSAINTAAYRARMNKEKPRVTRLEVYRSLGEQIREIADKRNLTVNELLEDAIYNYWKF